MEHLHVSSNFSAPFIRRPVATSLITVAILLSGVVAFKFLPVAPLPQVDFPTISVGANLPGASPETMASAVATPLERQFGRIAGVTQMTSSSGLGSTGITLQFDLNRDINAAARDVQAAINAARSQLPPDLPGQPNYRKANPADAPILLLSLTSENIPPAQIYDAADSILAQKLAQVEGVGQVFTWGSARPAVRVEVNPNQLNSYGISLEQIRNSLRSANANLAKGALSDPRQTWSIADTDQLFKAYEYDPLIVAGHQGAPVRLRDISKVVDSVEDTRNLGLSNGKPGVLMAIFRQPGANMIETVDRILALLPFLRASISPSLHLTVVVDRTTTIRASVRDVEIALVISILLVIFVVFAFLINVWATIIPSVAIGVSLFVSLTATPMMCARFLKPETGRHNRLYRFSENAFNRLLRAYDVSLRWVLRHQFLILLITLGTVCLNVYLFVKTPKGFFPQQDTGRFTGLIQGDQDLSFTAMSQKMRQFVDMVLSDPAVDTVTSFTGGGSGGSTARVFGQLKPLGERKTSIDQVIARIRAKTAKIPGAALYLQATQDLSMGGRMGGAQYQYTLQADDLSDLTYWAPVMQRRMATIPELRDVNSDQQLKGLQSALVIDRDTAARLGVAVQDVDNTLGDAFGQRQVSNIYKGLNQYHVVLEVAPEFQQSPEALKSIYVPSKSGKLVPLSAFAHYEPSTTAISVNHQGIFPAITLSFNLAPGASLGPAVDHIEQARRELKVPSTVHATFQGTAQAFQDSLSNQPVLIITALAAVYIVLGILYESFIHPITILSTIPSAGIGALLAVRFAKTDLSIIALIGIIFLIGIVKQNAILMIDFAVQAERVGGKPTVEAIYEACLLRFRPIMMTTMAALLGALPLALGAGVGSELRRPLGITIDGGLILSQMLTLFTTPVVYIYMDRLQSWLRRTFSRAPEAAPAAAHSD